MHQIHAKYESIVLFDRQHIKKLKYDTAIYVHHVRGHY